MTYLNLPKFVVLGALLAAGAGCGKASVARTVNIPFLNASNEPAYAPYASRIEGGVLAAINAVNGTGKFYDGLRVAALARYGTGNAIGGDLNDTLAEQNTVDQMMAASRAKVLIGPATWTTGQDFCTQRGYLCISHAAATVRNDPNYNFSFTTAGYYPGWVIGTAFDIQQQGYTDVMFVADYDTAHDIEQMSHYGLTVTSLPVPAVDPQNWANEPGGASPDAVAQQIIAAHPHAIILESAVGFAAIFQALHAHGFTDNFRIWVGGEIDFQDFIAQVGNVAAVGVNKVYDETKDVADTSYEGFLTQYKAWSNNLPPGAGDWELDAYLAAMLTLYTVHAEMVAQNATDTTMLTGDALRQRMLRLTEPDPSTTRYWLSDTANVLAAISRKEAVTVAGLGLPLHFGSNGTAFANELKFTCCQQDGNGVSTGVPTTTVLAPEAILAGAH